MSTSWSSGTARSRTAWPSSLSSALWRPTSSRRASSSPSAVKRAAACSPPVASNTLCAARRRAGQRGDHRTGDARTVGHRRAPLLDLVERRLTAEATAGIGDDDPFVAAAVDRGAQLHGDDVVLLLPLAGEAVGDGVQVVGRVQDALGQAEADRELEVVPGVRMVTASGSGSWPGPWRRISIGSSVTSLSGTSRTASPSSAHTRTVVTARRAGPELTASR